MGKVLKEFKRFKLKVKKRMTILKNFCNWKKISFQKILQRQKYKSKDNNSYHSRTNFGDKKRVIQSYILDKNAKKVLDVGCNSGEMSKDLLKHNIEVRGIDLINPKTLNLPSKYDYEQKNILEKDEPYCRDFTLFLSVYHHLVANLSLEIADEIFYKLLFKSKYLIFDSGGPLEKGPQRWWPPILKKHFSTTNEMLNHFGIPFETIGSWVSGGQDRPIVVFSKKDAENSIKIKNTYYRHETREGREKGLILEKDKNNQPIFEGTKYYHLKLGNHNLFGKNLSNNRNDILQSEIKNTFQVHSEIDNSRLVPFYGISEKFGLLFKYLEPKNSKLYKESIVLKLSDKILEDVNQIKFNNKILYFDFER